MTIDGETIGLILAVLGAAAGAVIFLLKTGASVEAVRVQTSADIKALTDLVGAMQRKHDEGFATIRPQMAAFEHRLSTSEKDVVEMKATLSAIEKSIARVEGAVGQLQRGIEDSLRQRAEDRPAPRRPR